MDWLMSEDGYRYVLIGSFVYAAAILVGAFLAKAPYGKLGSERQGISLSPRHGRYRRFPQATPTPSDRGPRSRDPIDSPRGC